MFPLQFVGMLGRFDLECRVSGGGRSSQVGALRLAISRALLCFLSEGEMETMRQGEWSSMVSDLSTSPEGCALEICVHIESVDLSQSEKSDDVIKPADK